MRYEPPIYRPPSEAYSLIIQVTLGCAHNKCTFCSSFQTKPFRIRTMEEVRAHLEEARREYRYVEKIFLADGDSLIIPTKRLLEILDYIKVLFPECQRVGTYGSTKAINLKGEDDLKRLAERGLGIIYMGLESGNEEILKDINKGVTAKEMITAGQKVKKAGIPISITAISGLGGRAKIAEHARDTALVLSKIDPDYIGLLTLMLVEGTVMYDQYKSGKFELLTPKEVMLESKIFLENIDVTDCVFRANHASNYLPLKGTLPKDRAALLDLLSRAMISSDDIFKSEKLRGL